MAKQINTSIGGVVKKVSKVPLSVGGVIKQAKSGKCGVGGVVKEFFSSETLLYSGGNGSSANSGTAYNGAVLSADSGSSIVTNLEYSFPAGSLQDKNLVITFANVDFDYYYAASIFFDVTGTGAQDFYFKNGTCYEKFNYVDTTWQPNTTYTYPISSLNFGDFSGITKFKIKFYASKSTVHGFGIWCKEIWIK